MTNEKGALQALLKAEEKYLLANGWTAAKPAGALKHWNHPELDTHAQPEAVRIQQRIDGYIGNTGRRV